MVIQTGNSRYNLKFQGNWIFQGQNYLKKLKITSFFMELQASNKQYLVWDQYLFYGESTGAKNVSIVCNLSEV